MIETWKEVIGYEGHYEVSNYGKIRSVKKGCLRTLRLKINNKGYYCVSLCKNGIVKDFKVHRIVGIAFVEGKSKDRKEIDHIDGNPKNNHASNLRWVTHAENLSNPLTKAKLRPYKIGVTPTNAKAVLMFDLQGNFIREFKSARQANLYVNGKDTDCVNACCRGQKRSYCGYTFKFAQ
jgi:hypothetical protein